MSKQFVNSIKVIPKWRFIAFAILLFALSANIINRYLGEGIKVSFPDILISQTNNMGVICFSFVYAVIFIGGDYLFEESNKIFIGESPWKKSIKTVYFSLAFSSIIMLVFLVVNYVASILISGSAILYSFTVENQFEIFHSIIFNTLRITALILFALLINLSTKKYFGSILTIFLCQFEYNFYYIFAVKPLLILPKYHTLISYDAEFELVEHIDFKISYLYWLIVLASYCLIFYMYFKKTTKRSKKYVENTKK